MKPIIYWHPNSPPCRGTWLCVQNLGVDIDWQLMKLAEKEQYTPEFLAINPMHCVPTMNDNGCVLWESRAISQYLANRYVKDTSLYPTDPVKRGFVDARLYFDATVMHARLRMITRPILYEGVTEIAVSKWEPIQEAFGYMENFLDKTKFIAGDDITLADLHILACFTTAKFLGADLTNFPKLQKWYETCRKQVKGFDEHEKFVTSYVELIKSKLK